MEYRDEIKIARNPFSCSFDSFYSMVQSSANVPPDTRSVSRHSITLYLCSIPGHWSVNDSTNSAKSESAQQNQLLVVMNVYC